MLCLSYPLGARTPAYGNGTGAVITPDKQMCNGDSCNTATLSFSNHLGTHVDCPSHFKQDGETLTDYAHDFWFCSPVQVLRIPLKDAEVCTQEHLEFALDVAEIVEPNAKAVLIVTGWHARRHEENYWKSPPGFHPEMSDWLRNQFPKIRFLGFDVISLSSFAHRDIGRAAHRAFLNHSFPVMVLEDMNLEPVGQETILNNMLVSPLFIDKLDGAPCTIWANLG
ncbi:MAG: cyclase family protein [SAR324 cluster bacterium]|nr:cyclase family protein [SAR324 cluster bacterium]